MPENIYSCVWWDVAEVQIKNVKGFALLIHLDGIVQLLFNNRANLFADMVINMTIVQLAGLG